MIKKEPADWVFFNVHFRENNHEAIAIYKGKIIDSGSIPYIFSNYRGFKDYNAQGNAISQTQQHPIAINESANGLSVHLTGKLPTEENTIWKIENGVCVTKHTDLLDPHWDDH